MKAIQINIYCLQSRTLTGIYVYFPLKSIEGIAANASSYQKSELALLTRSPGAVMSLAWKKLLLTVVLAELPQFLLGFLMMQGCMVLFTRAGSRCICG